MAENDHIVGSAEPLSPEETRKRLQEWAEWGVDLSLIENSLNHTPTERIQHMVGLLRGHRGTGAWLCSHQDSARAGDVKCPYQLIADSAG
jgi:hypothetical protein